MIYLRLPIETVADVDTELEELRVEHPGMSGITRSDLLRDIVVKAMAERRAKQARAAKPTRAPQKGKTKR